ncbi:hypothetical protein SLS54_002905 [Diplodia seriata]
MLRHQAGLRENRRVELRFDHHERTTALRQAADLGCSICSALARQLEREHVDLEDDRYIDLQAALASICGSGWKSGYYSLDFLLDGRWMRTFALRPREVFRLAQRWVSVCKCADAQQDWYPDRLLDLDAIKRAVASGDEASPKTRIHLLENSPDWKVAEAQKTENNRYVTLSHCWGGEAPLRLVASNRKEMMTRGIALEDMPPTFRDAVVFASRLEGVRYIWIDALCIVQTSKKNDDRLHADDWRTQAALMDKVYRKSYLNISATAASDSSGGLFRSRNPELLREDEVDLNVQDLLELDDEEDEGRGRSLKDCVKASVRTVFGCLQQARRKKYMKRCSVVDVSLWDDLVEDAAINKRAWVYQERLLAPRVVHFCCDQVAWECSERCCTERYPEGVPGLQLKSGVIVSEDRLKDLDPEGDGDLLQDTSVEEFSDLEKDVPRFHAYELWKRIVELYSQKELSRKGDKLMALAGLAKFFFDTKLAQGWPTAQQKQHPYVAGMWREQLEGQLLWRVEPRFEDGWIYNNTRRHPLRAPSFSWAALDVPNGVACGEYKDQNLLFRVEDVHMRYVDNRNKFGLVEGTGCRLLLDARVIQIELREIEPDFITPYGWWISGSVTPSFRDMYTDVYLDSPADDGDVFEPGAMIFCMPAATGERGIEQAQAHCICLLLQLTGKDQGRRAFKRIGLARLTDYEGRKLQQELRSVQPEKMYLY